jgi:predicted nucleic acid-binding protein
MDAVLLDTDVFSYLLKRDDPRAEPYRPHVRGKTVAISFVTVGELFYGARKKNWGPVRIAELETRLRSVVIVPFDLEICRVYAGISGLRTEAGGDRVIAANDRWIAACAIRHNLTLISNNRRHFDGIPNLTLISEAPAPRKPAAQRLPLHGSGSTTT